MFAWLCNLPELLRIQRSILLPEICISTSCCFQTICTVTRSLYPSLSGGLNCILPCPFLPNFFKTTFFLFIHLLRTFWMDGFKKSESAPSRVFWGQTLTCTSSGLQCAVFSRRPSQSGENSERISDSSRCLTTVCVISPALSQMSYQAENGYRRELSVPYAA